MSETLLQTKLFVPVTRGSLVPRMQLLERLNAGLNGRLTLISAPAGFGKTTLVVDWSHQLANEEMWQLAWYSLDEHDNDTSRFFTYFISTLQKINVRIGQTALELLQSPQAINLQGILTDLLNSLADSTQPIILTLDDYHLITNTTIHEGITFLLENAPPHFHLLLISRADPPFSLARLRAQNQMTDIRQRDLRFGPSETAEFLNQLMALDLPKTAVSALERRTEGWVAGLQMAALSLQGQTDAHTFIHNFAASNRYIFDYLAEEVLAQRPKGTRDFLLKTAVLERLCAPLCDAVLGLEEANDSPSQHILEQLEAANLFLIPLDDERRWYRYHHLFADLLQQQGRRVSPGQANVAHERASHWFQHAGFAEEAIQHALHAADYERATNLVTQYGEGWLRRGQISKILLWTKRLPAAWQYQNPRLILNYAWALIFRGRGHEVEEILNHLPPDFDDTSIDLLVLRGILAGGQENIGQAIDLLEKAEARLKKLEPTTQNQTLRGNAILTLAFNYFHQGDIFHAEQYYEIAVAVNREVGNWLGLMYAMLNLCELLVDQGRLHEAMAVFHDGLHDERQWAGILGDPSRRLVAAAPLHISLGQLYYEWNQLAEAETQLVNAIKLMPLSNFVDQCAGLRALAKLRLAQNQVEAVVPILGELEEIIHRANFPIVPPALAVTLATTRCALYQQRPSPDLRAAIERSLLQLEETATDPLYFVPFTQARVLFTLDRAQEALPKLEKLAIQTEADKRLGLWLATAVLLSIAYQAINEKSKALVYLKRAVQVAESPGYIRLFLDEGEPIQQLLAELIQQEASPSYAATLLTYFPAKSPPNISTQLYSPLSPREREVLQLIARGLTNQEIANQMVIAPSTAKRHVSNIYNKLGVNNRVEASARAYELRLVTLD